MRALGTGEAGALVLTWPDSPSRSGLRARTARWTRRICQGADDVRRATVAPEGLPYQLWYRVTHELKLVRVVHSALDVDA